MEPRSYDPNAPKSVAANSAQPPSNPPVRSQIGALNDEFQKWADNYLKVGDSYSRFYEEIQEWVKAPEPLVEALEKISEEIEWKNSIRQPTKAAKIAITALSNYKK